MWFPVELHSESARRGGLASAVKTALEEYAHYHIIECRKIANHQGDSSPTGAASTVLSLDGCSACYIGTQHMKPMAPFCGFTVSPELRIAYFEHLIDYEPLAESRSRRRWLAAGVHDFVHVLLHDYKLLNVVVLPLPIDGDPPAGFQQTKVDDRYHIRRTEQSAAPESAGRSV